ncbi:hypothetical protein [Sinorhizobium meliloti]
MFEAPAQPVDAIDTLGAGDIFIAHVLVGAVPSDMPPP